MTATLKTKPRTEKTPHDVDLSAWVAEQVALLRAGRLDEIDAANIAEELQDVGSEQYDKLESAFTVLLMHLLKWDHQPERRGPSWRNTIAEQRRRIARLLRKNPSLKSSLAELIADAYVDGRGRAAVEIKAEEDQFPAECPYTLDEIIDRPIAFEPAPKKGR